MGRQGTLVYWLLQMLNLVTGNLGRPGGGLLRRDAADANGSTSCPNASSTHRSGRVRHVWGHVPGNLLADYIEAPVDPLRALVVIGGNPIMAIPGEERLREAFPQLELVVTMDLYRSATAELSDYVLPVSDWLERADYRGGGVAIVPTAQYSEAVVAPLGGADGGVVDPGPDRAGARSAFGPRRRGIDFRRGRVTTPWRRTPAPTIDELRDAAVATPRSSRPIGSLPIEEAVAFTDRRVDCCPPSFAPLLERARRCSPSSTPNRPTSSSSSSGGTGASTTPGVAGSRPRLREGRHARNPLFMHPDDAAARGLAEGDPVDGTLGGGQRRDRRRRRRRAPPWRGRAQPRLRRADRRRSRRRRGRGEREPAAAVGSGQLRALQQHGLHGRHARRGDRANRCRRLVVHRARRGFSCRWRRGGRGRRSKGSGRKSRALEVRAAGE